MSELWIAKQVADYHAATVGLVDKPCWKVFGPNGLEGVVWQWSAPQHAVKLLAKQVMPRPVVRKTGQSPRGDRFYRVWSRRK